METEPQLCSPKFRPHKCALVRRFDRRNIRITRKQEPLADFRFPFHILVSQPGELETVVGQALYQPLGG
jgi:hypothetical protein